MSPTTVYLFLSALLLLRSADSSPLTTTNDDQTAYELLESFNFPPGLLPKGIIKYDLDRSTGRFHAYWNGSCSFSLEGSYQLRYKSTISGVISNNKLTDLTGVSVKVLFLWLNIIEVDRSGDDIDFSVGIASASFPIDNFFECPQCGCGLDCVNGGKQQPLSIAMDVNINASSYLISIAFHVDSCGEHITVVFKKAETPCARDVIQILCMCPQDFGNFRTRSPFVANRFAPERTTCVFLGT